MKKLLALLMAVTLTFQLVTPVFAEEIEETQVATEAVEVETEAPVTEVPTTEPPVPETAAPEETSAPTEPQPTTEVTESTETTASTEETTSAATEPTEETTEPALDLFAEDENVIASGECGANGDNLTWVLTDDGTLTISGSGKMKSYSDSSVAPWYAKADENSFCCRRRWRDEHRQLRLLCLSEAGLCHPARGHKVDWIQWLSGLHQAGRGKYSGERDERRRLYFLRLQQSDQHNDSGGRDED